MYSPGVLTIKRLHLASLRGVDGREWPVHGFVVTHPGGALLVDTGVGGPGHMLESWRVVNRTVADALAAADMSPADIDLVVNTHLHFDHCGQNAVFRHAPCYVQRAELARAERESSELYEWFSFASARWELLDGDTEIVPGVSVIATPGHTVGHQCVVVRDGSSGHDLLIGDAAYSPSVWARPALGVGVPGQAADPVAWHGSIERLRGLAAERIHFCHHTDVVHG